MLLETALVQVALGTAIKNALEITAAVRLLVNLQMLLQVAATRKLLVAELARKWLLSGMDPLVPYQIADLRERLLASRKVTAVGLGLVVHASMLLQRRVLSEGLVALRAVNRHMMGQPNQILLPNEGSTRKICEKSSKL